MDKLKNLNLDIVGKRRKFMIFSLSLMLLTIIYSLIFGVKLDVSFKGGTMITYSYAGEIDAQVFKNTAESAIQENVNIQKSTDAASGQQQIILSLAASEGISEEKQELLSNAVTTTFADNNIQTLSTVIVNPTIGSQFFLKGIVTVLFASLLIIVFVAIRFRRIKGWSAGVTAVISLLHDVFFVFATFVFCGIPLNDNFIAVVLTILGYSVNDTIIIYDRIRENERIHGSKLSNSELVNASVNQTLSRTVSTTVTTVIALVIMCIFAVIYNIDTIFSFSFPMIIGMLSGFYSSICLSGSMWAFWQDYKEENASRKKIQQKT